MGSADSASSLLPPFLIVLSTRTLPSFCALNLPLILRHTLPNIAAFNYFNLLHHPIPSVTSPSRQCTLALPPTIAAIPQTAHSSRYPTNLYFIPIPHLRVRPLHLRVSPLALPSSTFSPLSLTRLLSRRLCGDVCALTRDRGAKMSMTRIKWSLWIWRMRTM